MKCDVIVENSFSTARGFNDDATFSVGLCAVCDVTFSVGRSTTAIITFTVIGDVIADVTFSVVCGITASASLDVSPVVSLNVGVVDSF